LKSFLIVIALVLSAGLALVANAQPPREYYRQVQVDVTRIWTDSGLHFQQGDWIVLSAVGCMVNSRPIDWGNNWTGPDGEGGVDGRNPAPDLVWNCLIGKFGENGNVFYVGSFRYAEAENAQNLFLGINDYGPADNTGLFTVRIARLQTLPQQAPREGSPNPTGFDIQPNFPNPFNSTTRMTFSLPSPADVQLSIFDIAGRQIRMLINGRMSSGDYSADWNGRNEQDAPVPAGSYLFVFRSNGQEKARQAILLK